MAAYTSKTLFLLVLSIVMGIADAAFTFKQGSNNWDTPSFYLIAVSLGTSAVRPIYLENEGGPGRLNGDGFPAQHFFTHGQLKATLQRSREETFRLYVNAEVSTTGSCSSYGPLSYLPGETTSTNKCASYETFKLQPYEGNGHIGSKLVFNNAGGFYSCGPNEEIWYKKVEQDGPQNCYPVKLFTVPVVVPGV